MADSQILLVEGEQDRGFFELICRNLGLNTSVRVAQPKQLGGTHNTKEGVFNFLPTLLKQLADGSLARLGVVVDADTPPNGGFPQTLTRITATVAPFNFSLPAVAAIPATGLIYGNSDGLADFGAWVMPDNNANGMLEDWVKQCIQPAELPLFNLAANAVAALPAPRKFGALDVSKAEVATWMAWQKKPGHGLYRAVEDGLFDPPSPLHAELAAWLERVFI